MYTYFFCAKLPIKIPPQFQWNTHVLVLCISQQAMDCSSRSMKMWQGSSSETICWILETWGFVGSKRHPTQREVLIQPAAVQESSKSLSAVYRVARWLTLVISKFPSWPYPKLITTALFFPQSAVTMIWIPLKLQFPIVPFHPDYDSRKRFTKVTNDNCLSFVFHLGWATDISDCYHL